MSEVVGIDTWLYGRLTGDAVLMDLVSGVHSDVAPEGSVPPFVVFGPQVLSDLNTLNGNRIWSRGIYIVKAIGLGSSYVAIEPIANRLDQLLHKVTDETPSMSVVSSVRVEPIRYPEKTDLGWFRHLGGLYDILASAK